MSAKNGEARPPATVSAPEKADAPKVSPDTAAVKPAEVVALLRQIADLLDEQAQQLANIEGHLQIIASKMP
jgi:acyl-CoA reductase-like NAD-dependent aldehyde dehydrogenase